MALSVKKAKEHCGYEQKPALPICGNCSAFRSDMVIPEWMVRNYASGEFSGQPLAFYAQEKNLRCDDHGFTVKKMASCRLFKPKDTK